MNTLFKISEVRQRYAKIRQAIPQYWQDRAVDMIRAGRALRGEDPQAVDYVDLTGRVLAVLRHAYAQDEFVIIPGLNIVTNDGDVYYAQEVCGETPTDDFAGGGSAGLRLGSAATSPTKTDTDVTTFLSGSAKAIAATYPKTNDGDSDNTGAGTDIVSWLYSYTTAEGNVSGIQEGAIVDNTTTPTAALTHFLFGSSFSKTSNDTLKVFVNHEFSGV